MATAKADAPSISEDVILVSMTKDAFQSLPSDVQADLVDLAIEEDHRSDSLVQIIIPRFMAAEAFVVTETMRQCNVQFRMCGLRREVAS